MLLTGAVDSVSGTVSRNYDNYDRMTREVTPQGQIDYAYYANGLRKSMTVAGQTAESYTWDAANRLTQIAQGATTVGLTYDESNRRQTLTLPSGIIISYGFDDAGQLTSLVYKKGTATLGDLSYAYDILGRRTNIGGSFARMNLPGAVSGASYDAINRMTAWNGATLSSDANGNMQGDGTLSYVWDERDRLTRIQNGSTVVASFTYDAFNRRIGKTVSGTSASFLHDGWQIVQELNGATPSANLLTGMGLDEVFRRTQGSMANDYLADALGSTLVLTDSTGTVQTSYTYEPYGNTSASGTGTSNAFQYTGREDDGTGLYYYRNRYYNPSLHRFVSEDPMGLAAGQNLWLY